MGKKKKSGGKKSGKGKKKAKEPQITFKEAILAYQIGIVEKKKEDYLYEIKQLEEKKNRYQERNERLQSEQLIHLKNLLSQAKDYNKAVNKADVTQKEQVIAVMMEKWEAGKKEEQVLSEMRVDIRKKEQDISNLGKDVKYWTEYKDRGQHDHHKQIDLLEKELRDMQESYDEMAGHLEKALEKSSREIMDYTDDTLDKQKFIASEKAMSTLDKHARQEVLDNDWMKKEYEIHTAELAELKESVETLEKGNLEIMSELFECRIEDLKVSRNFYLTQFEDNDTLEDGGILEMDLAKVSLKNRKDDDAKSSTSGISRPKSAIQKYVEDKVMSLVPVVENEDEDFSEGDETYDGHADEDFEDGLDLYDNYLTGFEEESYDDCLNLGPLELKLLNLTGVKARIHGRSEPSEEELQAQECNPDQWPVTTPMIKHAITPRTKMATNT